MCASFFKKIMQAGTKSALPTQDEHSNGLCVDQTPSQDVEHVQQVINFTITPLDQRFLRFDNWWLLFQIFWFFQNVPQAELVSKQFTIQNSRLTRSNANKSVAPCDKGINELVKFITPQTLRNNAVAKKRQTKKRWGKVRAANITLRCNYI